MRRLAPAFFAAMLAQVAHGAHPLLTEDTGTQGQGNFQLELTGERGRESTDAGTLRAAQPAAVITYGLAETADLQIGTSYLRLRLDDGAGQTRNAGLSDVTVDVKWRFLERGPWSLALKPGIIIPVGSEARGLGRGSWTGGSLLVLSYEPGPVAFHSHAGYLYNNLVGERRSLWHFSGAVTWQATEALRLVADLAYDTNPLAYGADGVFRTVVGAIYSPVKNVDLDIGVQRGYQAPALGVALLAGLTLRW
ncbi:MAG: transporter [Gammaproteobacteria bacterium]|nr:transporter [Gammaproteobacteria bacterium]